MDLDADGLERAARPRVPVGHHDDAGADCEQVAALRFELGGVSQEQGEDLVNRFKRR